MSGLFYAFEAGHTHICYFKELRTESVQHNHKALGAAI